MTTFLHRLRDLADPVGAETSYRSIGIRPADAKVIVALWDAATEFRAATEDAAFPPNKDDVRAMLRYGNADERLDMALAAFAGPATGGSCEHCPSDGGPCSVCGTTEAVKS